MTRAPAPAASSPLPFAEPVDDQDLTLVAPSIERIARRSDARRDRPRLIQAGDHHGDFEESRIRLPLGDFGSASR